MICAFDIRTCRISNWNRSSIPYRRSFDFRADTANRIFHVETKMSLKIIWILRITCVRTLIIFFDLLHLIRVGNQYSSVTWEIWQISNVEHILSVRRWWSREKIFFIFPDSPRIFSEEESSILLRGSSEDRLRALGIVRTIYSSMNIKSRGSCVFYFNVYDTNPVMRTHDLSQRLDLFS